MSFVQRAFVVATLLLPGCWKDEFAELPPGILAFEPEAGPPPAGWVVQPIPVDLSCPDDTQANFYLLYPESAAAEGAAALPIATLYHSGSFDFVFAPDPADPLAGTHYAEPNRLTSEWAHRQVFATLGMYPDMDDEVHDGALPLALAEQGIAVLLPSNCWGDLWHNAPGVADGDFSSDFFFRSGRAAADWGHRFLVDPFFAEAVGFTLPITVDPSRTYLIGLGEGGRAVAEVLNLTNARDEPQFSPTAVLVDSPLDDLRFVYDDPTTYGNLVIGLDRIHQDGVDGIPAGSMHAVDNLPSRVGYVYSSADPAVPSPETFEASAASLSAQGWVYASTEPRHVLLNSASQLDLARAAVTYLVDGTRPQVVPGLR
jgi:hypothetical protein